jgi:hypothetical protein
MKTNKFLKRKLIFRFVVVKTTTKKFPYEKSTTTDQVARQVPADGEWAVP